MPTGSWDAFWKIGQSKDRPVLNAHLTENEAVVGPGEYADDPERYDPIDLTGATVEIIAEHTDGGGLGIADGTCTVVDVETGEIRFQAAKDDLIHDGTYETQFDITFEDGSEQRVPSVGTEKIWVGRNTRDTQLYDSISIHSNRQGGVHGLTSGERFASEQWVLDNVGEIEGLLPEQTGDIGLYKHTDFGGGDLSAPDGQYSGNHYRTETGDWVRGEYRPSVRNGGAGLEGERVRVTNGNDLNITSELTDGYWETEFEIDQLGDSLGDTIQFYPWLRDTDSGRNYVRVTLNRIYGVRLEERTGTGAFHQRYENRCPEQLNAGRTLHLAVQRSNEENAYTVLINGEPVSRYAPTHVNTNPQAGFGGPYRMQVQCNGDAEVLVDKMSASAHSPARVAHGGDDLAPDRLHVQHSASIGGRELAPAHLHGRDTIGLSSLDGISDMTATGPIINPNEPVHIGKVDINVEIRDAALYDGSLTFWIAPWTTGFGTEVGRTRRKTVSVSEGRNTVDLDLYLHPLNARWDGYLFYHSPNDGVRLGSQANVNMPLSYPSLDIEMSGHYDGTSYSSTYMTFMDMRVASQSTASGGGSGTGTAPADEENPEGAIVFVSPEDDAAGIQGGIDALGPDGGCVWLRDGTYTMNRSVEVPSNVRLTASQRGAVTLHVPDNRNLTRYGAAHAGTVETPLTNADHTNGNDNITIENLIVDYDGTNKTPVDGVYSAGIWLTNVTDSTVERCWAHDVLYDGQRREYGILFTDARRCTVRESWASRCGYEGIGFRGGVSNSQIIDCYCWGNRIHSMQVAGWTDGGAAYHRPHNTTIRGGEFMNDVIYHGVRTGNREPDDRDQDVTVDGMTGELYIFENVRNIRVRNHTGNVRLVNRQIDTREGYIGNVIIDGLEWNGNGAAPVSFEFTSGDELTENVTIRGVATDNSDGVFVVRHNVGTDGSSNAELRNVLVDECTVNSSSLARIDSPYSADRVKVQNNDLRDLNGWLTSGSGGSINVAYRLGNDGISNNIP